MNEITILFTLSGATVVLGLVFLAFVVQAYRKHRNRSMVALGAAVGLLVLGIAADIVAYYLLGATLAQAQLIEASLMLLAFIVLLVSVRAHRPKE